MNAIESCGVCLACTPRHDGSAWLKSDKGRESNKGSFGFFAGLMQLRGDWPFFKSVFGFAGWAGNEVCWRCKANKSNLPYHDCSANAKWRKHRYTDASFRAAMAAAGVAASVIFGIPGFSMSKVAIDVLHAMDFWATQEQTLKIQV